ncbi:unnamed protein product [Effrenium voratum]|nr:unnamed protein product [Effrenium voratum]
MAFSRSMALRYYIRVCLFFPLPAYGALFWTDSILLMLLACSALLAVPLHFLWMRKRLGPFLAFLSCVYAAQMALCLCMAHFRLASHHTAEAVKPDAPIQTISVVMTAHNEQQYLKRTLDSIIETTPAEVLVEIILIDDGSQPPLEVSGYDQVQLRRHERRGLVKSKMEGGNMARGDMIMFLDAHVKPTKGWYKPILRHVNINYKRVVVPLIPILDGDSWQINNLAVGVKMMFDWQLRFKWLDDGSDLVPCMSGGLFGITKRWWHESGEYDYGMNMWGGENIEQSIRIWLCGGEIFVARDSRIGHVFRKEFPYEINSTEIMINKVRAVETWFDDYKAYFYHAEPNAARLLPAMGSIEERLALKDRLHCKPFHWFVHKFHQVFHQKGMLPPESFQIHDALTGLCLQTVDGNYLEEAPCEEVPRQRFRREGGNGIQSVDSHLCLQAEPGRSQVGNPAKLGACTRRATSAWKHANGQIRFGNACLQSQAEGPLLLKGCKLKGAGPFQLVGHKAAESPFCHQRTPQDELRRKEQDALSKDALRIALCVINESFGQAAWEASGLPVKRLGSAKAAVELLRVWGDLEQLGVQEGVMSATYPIFEFSREEWDRTVGTAQDGTVITYEAVESSTSHSAGDPEGAVPEGGFSKPKTVCKIVSVVQPVEKASKPGVKA